MNIDKSEMPDVEWLHCYDSSLIHMLIVCFGGLIVGLSHEIAM